MPRFKPPTPEETQRALGPLESLPANLVRALTDLDNPCGDAVSAVREMRRFGLEPTYALPFLEGASD